MLINEKEVLARLNSSGNLISQIRNGFNGNNSAHDKRKNAMSLFTGNGQSRRIEEKVKVLEEDKNTTKSKEETKRVVANPFKKQNSSLAAPAIFSLPSASQLSEVFKSPEVSEDKQSEEFKSLDTLLSENEAELKLALAHNSALNLVEKAIQVMNSKIDNMKTSDLPKVVTAASRVVESIRKERLEINRQSKDNEVHFHFYTPQQKSISDYEVIEVESSPALG